VALVFFGDSTVDFGNLDAAARSLGERRPFRDKRYNGGGNVKASDGFVLGEQIARRLGARSRMSPARLRSAELINLSDRPLKRGLLSKDPNAQVFNFAYAGGLTSGRGSTTAGLDDFRIGLKSQTAAFVKAARLVALPEKPDLIISGGTNDVFDYLTKRRSKVRRVVITPGSGDDRRLAKRVARDIVSNIAESLDTITGLYDEAVVLGTAKLSALPTIRQASNEFRRVPLLGGLLSSKFRDFVDRISESINAGLERKYNSNDKNGIYVVNGFDAWKSLSGTPRFVDTIHPNSKTNGRLADFVVSQINNSSSLESFGL
jgi:hypothetical protein